MRRRARNPKYREELARLAPFEGLARLVIRRRGHLGLSQRELADRMGTSHSAISRIEGGQHAITVETLRRLADALETHLVVGFADTAHGGHEHSEPVSFDVGEAELVAVG